MSEASSVSEAKVAVNDDEEEEASLAQSLLHFLIPRNLILLHYKLFDILLSSEMDFNVRWQSSSSMNSLLCWIQTLVFEIKKRTQLRML